MRPEPRDAGRLPRFCVNCGAGVTAPGVCSGCWCDPRVPIEGARARVTALPLAPAPAGASDPWRDADDLPALVRAVVLGVLFAAVLSGLTLGVFALLLGFALVHVVVQVNRLRAAARAGEGGADPRLESLAIVACDRLGQGLPPVRVWPSDELNAFTLGLGSRQVVVLHSELCRRLPPDELLFVIGHELGHVRFGHSLWLTLTTPLRAGSVPVLSALLGLIFNSWSVRAEYSADRAGLLAVRRLEPAVAALERISFPAAPGGEPGADDRTLTEYLGTHPTLAHRIAALRRFRESNADWLTDAGRSAA